MSQNARNSATRKSTAPGGARGLQTPLRTLEINGVLRNGQPAHRSYINRLRVFLQNRRRPGLFSQARAIFWVCATVSGSAGMFCWGLVLFDQAPFGLLAIKQIALAVLLLWARERLPE